VEDGLVESLAFLVMLALPLMGSPGPVNVSLAAMGSAYGAPASLRFFAGCVLGSAFVIATMVAGLRAVLLNAPEVVPTLAAAACTYLLYLAWQIATATAADRSDAAGPASFGGGLLLALSNPKAWIVVAPVYSMAMADADDGSAGLAIKLALLVLVSLTVKSFWLYTGTVIGELTTTRRQARAVNVAFAFLLLSSLALALWVCELAW
jgi:threonine/homoserine/homoserine lactone efflux protein